MSEWEAIQAALAAVLSWELLLYMFAGALLGMLTGVLPGFGPSAACSMLLPITFILNPVGGILLLLGIYYGAMYGGTITSVLLNVPGEVASVVTCFDGYPMARQGRAGKALAISAIGSFVGGVVGLVGMLAATSFARAAIKIGPLELFGMTLLALTFVIGLASRSMTKALISALFGLFVGMVGLDPFSGTPRFTLGTIELTGGISFIGVIMGLFGVAEILDTISRRPPAEESIREVTSLYVTKKDLRDSAGAIGRGSIIGFFFGLIPGSPVVACSFASYLTEKRLSKHPEEFGRGAIQGVAGPETANNSLGISSMIPLLAFGIPASPTMAIILGAFLIHGLQPGPLMYRDHPDIAWTIILGLFIANIILVILSLPLVRIWVYVLRIPLRILYPITLVFMMLGAYSINHSVFDVFVMWASGLIGLNFRRINIPLAPAALTLILGPILEDNFRTSISLYSDTPSGLLSSPVANVCFLLILVVFAVKALYPFLRTRMEHQRISSPRRSASDERTARKVTKSG